MQKIVSEFGLTNQELDSLYKDVRLFDGSYRIISHCLLVNPLVPHYSERQDKPFSLQI